MSIVNVVANDFHVKKSISQFLKKEVIWDTKINEYDVVVYSKLIEREKLDKVNRRKLALKFWEDNTYIRGSFERALKESKLEDKRDKMFNVLVSTLSNEIDFRLPIAFAQEYLGTDIDSSVNDFILKGPIHFKYKVNYTRLEREVAFKREPKIKKGQKSYLDNLLLREGLKLMKDTKLLTEHEASELIAHITTNKVIEPDIMAIFAVQM